MRTCKHCHKRLSAELDKRTIYHPTCKRLAILETKRRCWHKNKGEYRPCN